MVRELTGQEKRAEIEAWWALVARILAFFLGFSILAFEAFVATRTVLLLVVVAAGLMGPMVSAGVAQVLQAMRGGGHHE